MKARKQTVESVADSVRVRGSTIGRWLSAMGLCGVKKSVASQVRRKRRLSLWFDVSE